MPKNKKPERKASTSDSDSGPDDRTPAKKSKDSKGDDSSEVPTSWSLGKNRFLKLTEFKNSWYLDVREFYNADGDMKPGRKGIMLTMEQWQKLKGFMGEIDEAIKRKV
ncbi:unnamed protein product [Phyllotreta striolata]|uniref:Transcriptional coactivator p15 (PC4) C-terminal domain-containing protein n=1 Tax=Phyllotreta striolata TaxID=444603 RepID=A0A9N9XLX9_PHYSR|nr:unnamed protein product [Phyllotreta striolata]